MKTEHIYVVCEHAKKEKRKLEERLKQEQSATGERGEEKKAWTRSRLQGRPFILRWRKEGRADRCTCKKLVGVEAGG